MYNLVTNINQLADRALKETEGTAHADRAHLITSLVAFSIGYKLPLPSAPLDDPKAYFIQHHLPNVEMVVMRLNEHLMFNWRAAMDQVKTTWKMRYDMVHNVNSNQSMIVFKQMISAAENAEVSGSIKACLSGEYKHHFEVAMDILSDPIDQMWAGE